MLQSHSCDSSYCDGVSINSLNNISVLQFNSVADICQGFQQGQPFLHQALITLMSMLYSCPAKLNKAKSDSICSESKENYFSLKLENNYEIVF